jgi:hypothetical protein
VRTSQLGVHQLNMHPCVCSLWSPSHKVRAFAYEIGRIILCFVVMQPSLLTRLCPHTYTALYRRRHVIIEMVTRHCYKIDLIIFHHFPLLSYALESTIIGQNGRFALCVQPVQPSAEVSNVVDNQLNITIVTCVAVLLVIFLARVPIWKSRHRVCIGNTETEHMPTIAPLVNDV